MLLLHIQKNQLFFQPNCILKTLNLLNINNQVKRGAQFLNIRIKLKTIANHTSLCLKRIAQKRKKSLEY